MRFRRRRRGRRKAAPAAASTSTTVQQLSSSKLYPIAALLIISINLFAIATLAQSVTLAQPANSTDLTGTTRHQLYKRQSASANSQFSAESPQVTFPNNEQYHELDQQQQQQQQNHYEEPLALASSEDAPQDSQQTRQNKGKRTLYACEEKQLEIDCQVGESIQLIRANYGRFSIQICNEHGQLDWKVNCMSSDSYDIIARSCQAKQSCQLLASNEIFGDACPGTQKYLEVHYQCVSANRTQPSDQQQQQSQKGNQAPKPNRKQGNTVIQQQQHQQQPSFSGDSTTQASNSETPELQPKQQQPPLIITPPWMGPIITPPSSPKQLPDWMKEFGLNPAASSQSNGTPPPRTEPPNGEPSFSSSSPSSLAGSSTGSATGHCPEIVWRSIRWPETEAGQWAQRPCPAHTFPVASSTSAAAPVSQLLLGFPPTQAATAARLYCQPSGQWAERAHIPGRCHSAWLRNLTQRLDTGDSPLSILGELVARTQPTQVGAGGGGPSSHHERHHQQAAAWLSHATSSSLTSSTASQQPSSAGRLNRLPLFGEDLVQMGRIVGRLVDEMGELLTRISDDKQRITFAREMIQLITELISNLLNKDHSEAWLDLAPSASTGVTTVGPNNYPTSSGQSGERQRVAGQLLTGLESGCVLLAGALQHHHQQQHANGVQVPPKDTTASETSSINQDDFQKITDHVYVAIQSFELDLKQPGSSQRLQVTFPSQTSVLGTRWMDSDQRFTLNLQASNIVDMVGAEQQQQSQGQAYNNAGSSVTTSSSASGGQQQQLKIVGVMLRGLGAHLEPAMMSLHHQQQREATSSDKSSAPGDSSSSSTSSASLTVNSDLVGFSIVADSTRTPIKVDLSAPIELVFRHNSLAIVNGKPSQPPTMTPSSGSHCVYWDTSASDWSPAGCKLVASNRTHSVCACDHLATFGLLNELDQMLMMSGQQQEGQPAGTTTTSGPDGHHSGVRLTRVHLDNVESELAFDGRREMKAIYVARLLEGALFTGQTGARNFLYGSCCLSGLLLAILLAAAAYNRAHARRLLGSLPAEPPPSLLVANYHNNNSQRHNQHQRQQQQQQLQPSLTAGADRMLGAQSANGLHANAGPNGSIGTGTTTTTNGASPPNSSSSGGLAGPTAAASMDLLAAGSAKQEPANMLLGGHDDELNGFYTLIGNQSSQYGASMANIKHYHQLSSSQRHLAAKTNHLTTANGGSGGGQAGRHSISQLALVPVHLIVQLLLLQLLLLLLIESQNMLAWNSQQAKRTAFMQTSAQMMAAPVPFNEFSAAAAAASFQTGTGFPPTGFEPLASEQQQQLALDPIGNITWLAVFALYYLVSTLVYWLLARLIQLTGQLMELNELAPSASASAGNGKQYQPIQTLSGGAIYTQQQQQQPTINRYGPCQIHQNNNGPQQQQQASSSSPSLSNFSSLLAAELSPMIEQQQQQQLGGRLEHLESRQSDKEQTLYMRQSLARSARQLHQRANGNNNNNHDDDELGASCSLARCLARLATSRHLAGLLVHLGPPLTGCLLVWLTYDRAELINLAAYTTSWTSQLAYWPLALDAGWTFPLAFHLYCLPSICLALGILALAMLRRQFSQIYKTQTGAPSQPPFGATLTTTKQRPNHRHLESESALMADAKSHHNHSLNQHQQQLQLLQRRRVAQAGSGGHLAIELAAESKRAKFACLTLLALLALTSICWISFFIHCHQAVNNANHHHQQQQQQTSPSGGGHLILTFASSNLLISLLICCSQRKQLKRACQLLGLSRFVSLAGGHCCQLAEATKSSPASTSSVSSSSYYNNNNNSNNNPNTNSFHGAPDHHQHHHQQHYGTGKSIKISSSAAASQQSLFVISRSRPVLGSGAHGSGGGGGVTSLAAGGMLAEIAQATYGSAAGTGHQHNHQAQYSQQQQQQQHLHQNQYPMLANQHLYQQLAHAGSQQHIYDSTTNLSSSTELVEQQKQRQLNAFNLMAQQQQNHRQQQQQQFNQHEPMIHYTLGRPFNGGSGSQFHLNQQQQQQQGQQHYFQGPGNMTLKPMPSSIQQQQQMSFAAQQQQGARSNPHESLVCPINGAAKTHSASSSGRQQQQFQQQQQQQQLSASSSSSSGEADGPLVALAQTTTPTLLNNRRHELSNAMAANQSASPATFGPMHNYNSAMIMGSSSNNNNSQQATEHRLSSGSNHHNNNNNNDNQSFVEVIGHGAGNGANHCTAGPQAAAPSVKPIKHNNQNNNSSNNYNYNQIDQHLGKQTILGATSSQNYTDALKAAMVEEANQQHFRRTNSTAKRQQRQPAPPHRSFASTTVAGASSAAMIDAQLDYQSRPLGFGGSCSASGSHGEDTLRVEQEEEEQAKETQNDSNIYDVANCSPLVSR